MARNPVVPVSKARLLTVNNGSPTLVTIHPVIDGVAIHAQGDAQDNAPPKRQLKNIFVQELCDRLPANDRKHSFRRWNPMEVSISCRTRRDLDGALDDLRTCFAEYRRSSNTTKKHSNLGCAGAEVVAMPGAETARLHSSKVATIYHLRPLDRRTTRKADVR